MEALQRANDILAPEQAGFRQFRATEDQTTYLAKKIEDAFQEKKVIRVAWIDLHRAIDKVWIDGLIVKLMRNGVANSMLKWILSYSFNRRARVSLDQLSSRKILIRQGVHQGGALSPTLFLVFMTWCPKFPGALRQHCTLLTWYYGAKRNMPAQPTTGFNKPLTNLQHGLRTGVSLSTRTNPPQHYAPCHQRGKLVPSRYTHSERRRRSHLPCCNFRQEAGMEAAYPTHRGKGAQEAGKHAQTSWNNMGS